MMDFSDRTLFDEKGSLLTKRNNDKINSYGADYNMIVGQRANGKTYPTITFDGIRHFIDSDYKKAFAYVRRWDSDLKVVKNELFNGPMYNGWLEWYSKGKWNNIQYYQGKWYLRHMDKDGKVDDKCKEPLAYAFAINLAERYKGPDYPTIKTIILDEFIPERGQYGYLPNEWRLWLSIVSSIVRERGDVKIYMIANTISKNCIYFDKFNIDIDKVEQGTIEVRKYKNGGTLALEYCKNSEDITIESTKYFEIDDTSGNMITSGNWETSIYPTIPIEFERYNELIVQKFFVIHKSKIIEGDFIKTSGKIMIYFHKKTTPIKPKEYVYIEQFDNQYMHTYTTRIGFNPNYQLDKIILSKIKYNECYYQNNDIGETIKYFLQNT